MHNKIFSFDNQQFSENEVFQMVECLGIDYIEEEKGDEKKASIQWLAKTYNFPIKNGEIKVEFLVEALQEEKFNRIENTKKILKKEMGEIDPWAIAHEIYNKKGFYYIYQGILYNEMDLLEEIQRLPWYNKLKITQVFDYHF